MVKTTLEIFGGLNKIGGNKICITASNGKAAMLDFGLDFVVARRFTDSFLKLRDKEYLLDAMTVGMLPRPEGILKNLYRQDLLLHEQQDLKEILNVDVDPEGKPMVKDVLLTHVHTDHSALIRYLNSRICLITGKTSAALLDHFNAVTRSNSSLRGVNECKMIYSKAEDGSIEYDEKAAAIPRHVFALGNGESMKVAGEGLEATFYETDHSVPGAGGFLIRDVGTNARLAYTGDIRMHGIDSHAREFIDAARDFIPDVLIIEGTRIGRRNDDQNLPSEAVVKQTVIEYLKSMDNSKMVFFDCSARDVWRFITFHEAAKSVGRSIVIDADIYLLLEICKNLRIHGTESLDLNDVYIYISKASSGMYLPRDYSYSQDIVEAFTDPALKNSKGAKYTKLDFSLRPHVKAKDIRDNPEKYLMYLPFFSMNELPDLHPPKGSYYIKSASGPYDDEGKIDERKKKEWLDLFEVTEQLQAHCSGHASPEAIEEMINIISPKIFIPVHTEHAAMFKKMEFDDSIKIKILNSSKPFTIKEIDDVPSLAKFTAS